MRMVTGHELTEKNKALLAEQAQKRNMTITVVGGYQQWKANGRIVKKGEKSLKLMAPTSRKIEIAGQGQERTYFNLASVFDISQTEELQTS